MQVISHILTFPRVTFSLFTELNSVVLNQITDEMNITQNHELIEIVIKLADRKATGNPSELSDKIGVSQRNLYRIIDYIKDLDIAISYSRTL